MNEYLSNLALVTAWVVAVASVFAFAGGTALLSVDGWKGGRVWLALAAIGAPLSFAYLLTFGGAR